MPAAQQAKTLRGGVCSKEPVLLQGSQVRSRKNKFQICLPDGKGLGVFTAQRINKQGGLTCGERGERRLEESVVNSLSAQV